MDRLQYNILLEEAGIYDKKEVTGEEIDACDNDFLYKTPEDSKYYEIINHGLSTEEIKISLLVQQTKVLQSICTSIGCIVVIFVISLLIGIICLIN